jgi:DNA-binding transcriptional LysR family regulator
MPVASRGRDAARRQRSAGRLRVDAAAPFMPHAIVPHVSYCARYSEVELELTSNDGVIALLERRTDLAIRSGALRDSSLHARALGSSRLRVLASPDHLARRGVPRRVDGLARHAQAASPSPSRSTTGRCAAATATRCTSARRWPAPAARPCANWRWPTTASPACPTS